MSELIDAVASWQGIAFAILGFGIAPGVVLRLLVLIYPKGDPRRAELVAELYAVPRIQRPIWVAEQLEVAIFEGGALRWRAIRSGRSPDLKLALTGAAFVVMQIVGVILIMSVSRGPVAALGAFLTTLSTLGFMAEMFRVRPSGGTGVVTSTRPM